MQSLLWSTTFGDVCRVYSESLVSLQYAGRIMTSLNASLHSLQQTYVGAQTCKKVQRKKKWYLDHTQTVTALKRFVI